MDASAFKPAHIHGFLVSQVGYDAGRFKQALLRSTDPGWMDGCRFEARDVYNGRTFLAGEVVRWGVKWSSTWWTIPLTDLYRKGTYRLHVFRGDAEVATSDPFDVAEDLVWERTVDAVCFEQFEARARQARHGLGWKDCGSDWWPEEAADWLHRSEALFQRFLSMEPHGNDGYSRINRGLPESSMPEGFMTRDLTMALWAGIQLASSGHVELRESLFGLAQQILERQIREDQAESGFWGHFREFATLPHSEKANTHHDVGHDTGTVLAFNVLPLIDLVRRFPTDQRAPRIRQAVNDFARHFVAPACRANPFLLLPQGVFGNEGLLDFCGPWHGTNVTYGYFSSMAVRLGAFCEMPELFDAAIGNMQWICGLHAGITREAMAGAVVWRETIPEGLAVPYSQIIGVGRRAAGGWTDIRGTIVNGFATNPQFTLQVPPSQENDGPWLFTEEDWIPHAGGFLSGAAAIRNHFSAPWNR